MVESVRKKFVKTVGVHVATVLDWLGINSKEFYEYSYWRVRKWKEPVLTNDHYEPLFTKWVGLTRDFYTDKSVLDIGCGPRGSLEWLNDAKQRVGLDTLVNSYKKLGIENHEMEYVHANAELIPFPDGHFDVVTSFNSLDHVENPEKVLTEVCRVLRPGGSFVVVVEVHEKPTIAEPVVLQWNFLDSFKNLFEIEKSEHLQFNPKFTGAIAALQSRIPIEDYSSDGVIFAIARKK